MDEKAKEKQSLRMKERWKNPEFRMQMLSNAPKGANHYMYGKHLPEETKIKISESIRGCNHPNWKGGRVIQDGYVLIYNPHHPFKNNGNYVFEHRLVMEQWLRENEPNHPALTVINGKKYLNPKWQPHHINEKRDDNKAENLGLMTIAEHTAFHHKGRKDSEETKIRRSIATKGKNNPMYGRHHSEETKRKISLSSKGDMK